MKNASTLKLKGKGEEDDASCDKNDDKDKVEVEALWPFCGISGARYSIFRAMLPPYACIARVVTLAVDRAGHQ